MDYSRLGRVPKEELLRVLMQIFTGRMLFLSPRQQRQSAEQDRNIKEIETNTKNQTA